MVEAAQVMICSTNTARLELFAGQGLVANLRCEVVERELLDELDRSGHPSISSLVSWVRGKYVSRG